MTVAGLIGYALLRVAIVAVPVFIAVEVIYFVRRWRNENKRDTRIPRNTTRLNEWEK